MMNVTKTHSKVHASARLQFSVFQAFRYVACVALGCRCTALFGYDFFLVTSRALNLKYFQTTVMICFKGQALCLLLCHTFE